MTRRFSTDGAEERLTALFAAPPDPLASEWEPDGVDAPINDVRLYLLYVWGIPQRAADGVLMNLSPPERRSLTQAVLECTRRNHALTGHHDGGPWIVGAVLDADDHLEFSVQFDASRVTS